MTHGVVLEDSGCRPIESHKRSEPSTAALATKKMSECFAKKPKSAD